MGTVTTVRTTESDNSWSLINREDRQLIFFHVAYTSDATVGNRQISIEIDNAAGDEVVDIHSGAVQAASLVRDYLFNPGVFRETSFVDNAIHCPFPAGLVIPGNHTITILDKTAVSTGDSMIIGYQLKTI